jgi:hypothetical protein
MYLKPYTVCDIVGQLAYPGFFQFVYYFNTQILSMCLDELLLNHATNINDKISSCKPHISYTRVFGFFFHNHSREAHHYAPLSPSNTNTHTTSPTPGPLSKPLHTHTHHISNTRVFRFFYNNSREAHHPPSLQKHTHTHSLSLTQSSHRYTQKGREKENL